MKNPKNDESTTTFDDLPPEMAVNILFRLPVKALVKSTSVNKNWYSLITNPSFISAQLSRAISCRDENAVLVVPTDISKQKYCSLISAETGFVFDKYEIPFTTRSQTLRFVASLNGLLLLTDTRKCGAFRDLYLWNPSVRKYLYLDSSYYNKLFNRLDKQCSYAVGLGFNEAARDYRVVRVLFYKRNRIGKWPPRAEIFSLRMNEWREIKNPAVSRLFYEIGTTVNSRVYWIDTRKPKARSQESWILSFDFNTEVFGEIRLPDNVRYCLGDTAIFGLMKFEGLLSVCASSIDIDFMDIESNWIVTQPCCIWLMRHEDGIVSWTLRFRVVHSDFGLPEIAKIGYPFNITNGGILLMILLPPGHPHTGLLSCNLKTMHYKDLGFIDPFDENYLVPAPADTSFIESLVMHVGQDGLLKSAKAVPDTYESPGAKLDLEACIHWNLDFAKSMNSSGLFWLPVYIGKTTNEVLALFLLFKHSNKIKVLKGPSASLAVYYTRTKLVVLNDVRSCNCGIAE